MKTKLQIISMLALAFMLVPAAFAAGFDNSNMCAGTNVVYCNGPINAGVDAWTINSGFLVSDSFTITTTTTITAVDFGAWLFSGDVFDTVGFCISTADFCGGTVEGSNNSASVSLGPSNECNGGSCDLGTNGFGFDVQSLVFGTGSITLAPGTYWLTLDNAVMNDGDPVYWDENSGPSSGEENSVGTIPSESFALVSNSTSTPEPGTLALVGCGALLAGGVLRRKLRKS